MRHKFFNRNQSGFTLIEVLLALTIIAIALTALLKVTGENISITGLVKEKNTRHWVAMQGIILIQLGVIPVIENQEISEATDFLEEKWYWHARIHPTSVQGVREIVVTTSKTQSGPFTNPLIGYQYHAKR